MSDIDAPPWTPGQLVEATVTIHQVNGQVRTETGVRLFRRDDWRYPWQDTKGVGVRYREEDVTDVRELYVIDLAKIDTEAMRQAMFTEYDMGSRGVTARERSAVLAALEYLGVPPGLLL